MSTRMQWTPARSRLLPNAALALIASMAAASAGDAALDPVKLANLVRQDCGSCHGLTLKGGLGKPLTVEQLGGWDRDQLVRIMLEADLWEAHVEGIAAAASAT